MNDYILLELGKARHRQLMQEADALRLAKLARADRPRIRRRFFPTGIHLVPQQNVALRVVESAACDC